MTEVGGRVNPLGRYGPDGEPESEPLHRVRLVGMPVRLWTRTAEHHDALQRELALLALDDDAPELPRRLTALLHELRDSYGGSSSRDERQRADATERGLDTIDLEYEVPASVREAAQRLTTMLDEVDEFCANDSLLLTLASTPEERDFRHWYCDEFVRQIEGEEPRPWTGPLD